MKKTMPKRRQIQRALSALLTVVMVLGMLPPLEWTAHAASWMDEYIETAVDWGVMRGDVDGNLNAEKSITRAEFVTMVNRAFGYSADTTHPFTDVTTKDWYHNDIGMAYNKGYFKGTSDTTASPEEPLTREQAVVLIGRNLLLNEKVGETLGFSDSRAFSEWSRGMVESAIDAGYVGGYDDGSFLPQKNVSRGEVAAMLVRAIGTLVNDPGTHTLGGVYGNVMVSTSGVTLKNTTIAGNLYITGGLELGDIMLDNVEVLGKIIVSGAGESSKGDSSIVLRNVESGELVIDSLMNQFVTLRAEGETQIDFTNVKTSAYLDDQTKAGDGLLYIEMNGEPGMNVTMAGNVEEVLNATPRSSLTIAQGAAKVVTMDEKAVGSSLEIKNIAAIEKLNLDVATPVRGAGDIKDIHINAAGSIVDILPDKVEIRPGLTASIKGEQMDTQAGQESSSEPRILAGYPKARNLAPTSANVLLSTNKKGTIYWALTSLIDGPVGADDLIAQKDYTTKIQQQGSFEVKAANTEEMIKLSNLVSDGSYYISMVLVDNRDQRSPEKFLAFTTPDGTAPSFASGYPELTLIGKDYAQLAVMPTKSSTLYYVVLPKGAAAPTIAEFKAGAISGDIGNCPKEGIEVEKNFIKFTDINDKINKPLEELKSYDLYLCLIDPDNGKDSGVRKISFTTVDGTPPILGEALVTGIQKNGVNVTTSLNEVGTIYWVAVKEGVEYLPKDGSQNPDYTSKKSILQVVNGMGNIIKSGKASAAANKDTLLKVSGLEPQTAYDIYYVAEDKAGNYSVEVKKITVNTLDVDAPTVRQEFTKTADAAGLNPLADTDIRLIFSENVRNATAKDGEEFWNLYKEGRIDELVAELSRTVQLWDISNVSATYQIKDDPLATAADMGAWINYKNVRMEMNTDTGELVLIFEHGKAISLSSGGTYQFVLENVTDTSNTKNPMKPNPYKLNPFTTVFAQVNLTSRASSSTNVPGMPIEKGMGTQEADVDMRFWMDPQSANSVNNNVYYDIWFETENIIVYFDLYCRVINPAAESDADKVIKDPAGLSMFGMKLNDQNGVQMDKNGWIYLGNMDIRASGGTARGSINSLIHGTNTIQISQLNTLKDEYTYEFVIDVTTIDDSSEQESWSAEVDLKVLVPAGQDLTATDFVKEKPWTNDVVNIANPEDFSVSRQFVDTKTPKFRDGYPTFASGDTSVNMNIMLDRAGTFYYVVAPLVSNGAGGLTTSVATTVVDPQGKVVPFSAATGDSWFKLADPGTNELGTPPSSGELFDPSNPLGPKKAGYKITAPSKDSIALMVDNGASSLDIKTDKKEIGVTRETIKVTGLMPTTTYIVYCILAGQSQQYSDVYCFQFTTQQVSTPTIELNLINGGSTVEVTTSTSADLSWALYTNTIAERVFGSTFISYVDAEKHSDYYAMCSTILDKNSNISADTLTVLDALMISLNSKQSLFDVFANDYIKNFVRERVQMEASTYEQPVEMGNKTFDANRPDEISPDNMSADVYYYIITAAKNTMGDSYGFKAQSSMHLADITPPKLQNTTQFVDPLLKSIVKPDDGKDWEYNIPASSIAVSQGHNGGYFYRGKVSISFSEEIYQLKKAAGSAESELIKVTGENFEDLIEIAGLKITKVSVAEGTISIEYEDAMIGAYIVLFKDGNICDQAENVSTQGARLELRFDTGLGLLGKFTMPEFKVEWKKTEK